MIKRKTLGNNVLILEVHDGKASLGIANRSDPEWLIENTGLFFTPEEASEIFTKIDTASKAIRFFNTRD